MRIVVAGRACVAVLGVSLGVFAACATFGGGDGPNAGPDSSLDCPIGCLPPAPPGWTGPSAVFDDTLAPGSTLPACPDAYPQREIEGYRGLDAGPSACSCGAGVASGTTCSFDVRYYVPGPDECTVLPTRTTHYDVGFDASPCDDAASAGYFLITAPVVNAGTCSFPAPSRARPDAAFDRHDLACGLRSNGACAGRTDCLATPDPGREFNRICIHTDGDHDCPLADYAQRFVLYRSVDDSRDCSPCTGPAEAQGACGSAKTASNACVGGTLVDAAMPCQPVFSGYPYLLLGGLGPLPGGCPVTGGGQPVGEARPTDPVTFCCNK